MPERHPETLLSPREGDRGQNVAKRRLKYVFAADAAKLHRGRYGAGKLDQTMIEKWSAHLDTCCHAGAIDVHEILPRQVELAVLIDEAVHRLIRGTARLQRPERLVRVGTAEYSENIGHEQ